MVLCVTVGCEESREEVTRAEVLRDQCLGVGGGWQGGGGGDKLTKWSSQMQMSHRS